MEDDNALTATLTASVFVLVSIVLVGDCQANGGVIIHGAEWLWFG